MGEQLRGEVPLPVGVERLVQRVLWIELESAYGEVEPAPAQALGTQIMDVEADGEQVELDSLPVLP